MFGQKRRDRKLTEYRHRLVIKANDPKRGMTAFEIKRALRGVPHGTVPKFRFKMNGTVSAIEMSLTARVVDPQLPG